MKPSLGLLTIHGFIFANVMLVLRAQSNPDSSQVVAFLDKSITLSCPDNTESDHVVWTDGVYNVGRDPIVIYDSKTGKNRDHLKTQNHFVEADSKDLTISNLTDADAGKYFCHVSKDGGATEQDRTYELSLISQPECEPKKGVKTSEGTDVNLMCTWQFTGQGFPDVEWINSRGMVESKDKSDFFGGGRAVEMKASYKDDKDTYECVISVRNQGGILKKTCEVPFSVEYAARNLTVEPDQESYTPGQTLRFSALGNPAPTITLDPPGQENDDGSVSVTITEDMLDGNFSYTLTAGNKLSAGPQYLTKSFSVMKPTTVAPSTTIPADGDSEGTAAKKGGVPVVIIGAVVGVVVLIILIVLIVIIVRRKKSKPKGAQPVPTSEDKYRKIDPEKA